ncbi:MAG: peptide deformylase [Chlamydiia bacterium]|nr:peptide deformylase [Chlamydiia bacterium]
MKLPIRYLGDPLLRTKAKTIAEITPEIEQLAQDMIETMIANNGVGLAGPQVGKLLRIYVFRDEKLHPAGHYELGEPQVAINPVFTEPSKETESMLEGCLSIPGLHLEVSRPARIRVRYQDLSGAFHEQELTGFLARVNMHENDHLNGVLYIDRLSAKERKQIEPELQKIKQKYAYLIS